MGVNFSPFEIGRRALRAGQLGVSVAGQNIANVNTPGYSRQSVQLSAAADARMNARFSGTGVTIDGVRAFRDRFVESRLQTETAISGRLTAKRDALAPVDAAFNEAGGGGVNSALVSFFGSFRDLEAHPTSVPLRVVVVENASALSSAFNSTRARLASARSDADQAVRTTIEEVNTLAREVAGLNAQISAVEHAGANASELRDQRGEVVRRLAELTGARSGENEDGMTTLTLADGRALVNGDHASRLEAVTTAPDGLAAVMLDGQPAVVGDGRLRGLLDAVGEITQQINSLDEFAASVASRVNELR